MIGKKNLKTIFIFVYLFCMMNNQNIDKSRFTCMQYDVLKRSSNGGYNNLMKELCRLSLGFLIATSIESHEENKNRYVVIDNNYMNLVNNAVQNTRYQIPYMDSFISGLFESEINALYDIMYETIDNFRNRFNGNEKYIVLDISTLYSFDDERPIDIKLEDNEPAIIRPSDEEELTLDDILLKPYENVITKCNHDVYSLHYLEGISQKLSKNITTNSYIKNILQDMKNYTATYFSLCSSYESKTIQLEAFERFYREGYLVTKAIFDREMSKLQ